MAPWWPGTALLSPTAPRKLVFLFTLSLSVTYLFYSLLSCYTSLQFPLQDAGASFLQPEPGGSPVGTIRTASLKPQAGDLQRSPALSAGPKSKAPPSATPSTTPGAGGQAFSGQSRPESRAPSLLTGRTTQSRSPGDSAGSGASAPPPALVGFSTSDRSSGSLSSLRLSSTADSAPAPSVSVSPFAPSTALPSPALRSSAASAVGVSGSGAPLPPSAPRLTGVVSTPDSSPGPSFSTADSAFPPAPDFSTADSGLPPGQDFSTEDSASPPASAELDLRTKDPNRGPGKPYTGLSAFSSGESSASSAPAGYETYPYPPHISSWDHTPLAATEMIPESQTGFLERDPQESSTTEEELGRRFPSNSTPEYGDKKLPQAIIIGVKKGGTRALLEALRAHPDVRAVGVEPHFFDRNYEKGLEWYRDLMPRTVDGQITMEKTPSYFVTNEAPQRIHSMAKDTKVIVVVRNPVTRAISDYTQTLSKKPEIPTFEVLAFKNRTLGLIDASWSALRIGIYALHLESWMQYFPLSQILFVSGERLISNPAEEMAKVQEFLGLRRIITDKYFYFNKTKGFPCLKKPEDTGAPRCLGKSKGRTHPKIDPDVIQRLRKFYKPFNAMFYQMTGQDFQWEQEELDN
ncbi:uncharacterized protein LOC142463193 [Ascaphus truei]|uniref:uncharacterized protein LOC142463193 n=1 Tax=Ascaphus truei TaxID=8439 RepID=UPI003F5ACF3A